MELKGKIIQVFPIQTGTKKSGGEWQKQAFVIETESQFPKKVSITIWGNSYDENLLSIGNPVTVHFDLESREYNGKWYTDVKAWKIEGTAQANPVTSAPKPEYQHTVIPPDEEQLPF